MSWAGNYRIIIARYHQIEKVFYPRRSTIVQKVYVKVTHNVGFNIGSREEISSSSAMEKFSVLMSTLRLYTKSRVIKPLGVFRSAKIVSTKRNHKIQIDVFTFCKYKK